MVSITRIIAANLRARLAWADMKHQDFALRMGWSRHTCHNKLHAVSALSAEEVSRAAQILGIDDPGLLFSAPPSFSEGSLSAWIRRVAGQTLFSKASAYLTSGEIFTRFSPRRHGRRWPPTCRAAPPLPGRWSDR